MRVLRQPDCYLALACLLGGLYLAYIASDFSGRARHFPFWLSISLAVSGAAVLAATVAKMAPAPKPENVQAVLRGALPFAVLMLLWAVALTYGLGYVLPGFVCAAGMLFVAGERDPVRIAISAALIVLACFLTFSVIFNIRLPELSVIDEFLRPIRRLIH